MGRFGLWSKIRKHNRSPNSVPFNPGRVVAKMSTSDKNSWKNKDCQFWVSTCVQDDSEVCLQEMEIYCLGFGIKSTEHTAF